MQAIETKPVVVAQFVRKWESEEGDMVILLIQGLQLRLIYYKLMSNHCGASG